MKLDSYKRNDSMDLNKDNKPDIHNINRDIKHIHWFPVSREEEGTTFGYYVHKHTTHPHTSKKVPNYNFDYYIDRYARFSMNFYPNK